MSEAQISDDGTLNKKRKLEADGDSAPKKMRKRKRSSLASTNANAAADNAAEDAVNDYIPEKKKKIKRKRKKPVEEAGEDDPAPASEQQHVPVEDKKEQKQQRKNTAREAGAEDQTWSGAQQYALKKKLKKVQKRQRRADAREAESNDPVRACQQHQVLVENAGDEKPSQDSPNKRQRKRVIDPTKAAKEAARAARKAERGPTQAQRAAWKATRTAQGQEALGKDKIANIQLWAEHSSSESSKVKAKKAQKKALRRGGSKPSTSRWTLSPPTAGRWLNIDPIFVQDNDGQDYLISANAREVQLLSLETSLIVCTFAAPPGRSIQCFAAGKPEESLVQIAFDNGSVCTWDYMNDAKVGGVSTLSSPILAMASPPNNRSTLIYLSEGQGKYRIHSEQPEQVLFETEHPLENLLVFENMEYIVAQGPSCLVLGSTKNHGHDDVTEFVWTQIPLKSSATCIHARLLPIEPPTKKTKPQRPGLSLAIGNQNGQIHFYEDISTLTGRDGKPQLPTPRILHWHREAVSSVKFSQDGIYLISGGRETVLVLWQLQTAKKQYLPHLTSTIERIAVNRKGDRYALQMGDNSIMVLSTSELKPVANFAGLQVSRSVEYTATISPVGPAAALHPRHPNEVLLSVPSTQPKSVTGVSARAFLQTFDLSTSRHVARQALTRNNVTDFNMGPEDTPIVPPDVNQIALSHDGTWLATVDEWTPPSSDFDHLVSDHSDLESPLQSRREVYLKFWRWDTKEELWTLTTRADSPHTVNGNSLSSGKVLALASNPSTNSFATIGEDFCVKIWKPKKRTRHGAVLKDRADTELMEWNCRRTVHLPHAQERVDSPFSSSISTKSTTVCLSYAADGSMLAASLSTATADQAPLVHFINPATAESIPNPGLAATGIVAMGFLDQHFIAVSHLAAYVWDLVNDSLVYKIKLSSHKSADIHPHPALTIDAVGGTFALVTTNAETQKTKVSVYKPRGAECQYEQTFDVPIEAVLAASGAKGYTLLLSDATARTLSPGANVPNRTLRTMETKLHATVVAPVITTDIPVDEPEEDREAGVEDSRRVVEDDEDDRPVVRPEQLANLFDTPQSFALPPVRDMFEAVVGLFGRRPYVKPLAEVA